MGRRPDHWRREVEGTDHGRSWAGVALGVLVTFLVMELPALGGKAGDTLLTGRIETARQVLGTTYRA